MTDRHLLTTIAWLLLAAMLLNRPAMADTPIFLGAATKDGNGAGGVDAERLYARIPQHVDDGLKSRIAKIGAEVVGAIDDHAEFEHFARPVEDFSELPDDLLLLVVSVEGVDELTMETDRFGRFASLLVAVSLQLADPRTGQVVYSDFDVVDSASDFDKAWNPRWSAAYDPGRSPVFANRGWWRTNELDREDGYIRMLRSLILRMTADCLRRFDPAPVQAEVVRMINGRALVNAGRSAGLFPGSRLGSDDGEIVLAVEEAYSDYCFAEVVHGPRRLERWTPVRGFRAGGIGGGSTLVGVTRVVYSDDFLNKADLAELKADEDKFQKQLQPSAAPQSPTNDAEDSQKARDEEGRAIYQSLIATRLTEALAATGEFRLTYPVTGLAALNRAKMRMNQTLNLKRRESDPFFFESLVIPDQGVVAVLSNPMFGDLPVIDAGRVGGKILRYSQCLCDLHLYETRSLGILASGHAVARDALPGNRREGGGGMALEFGKPHLRLLNGGLFRPPVPEEGYPGGALHVASRRLVDAYEAQDVLAKVESAGRDSVTVGDTETSATVFPGQPVDVCYLVGELALHQESELKVPILQGAGYGRVAEVASGSWRVDIEGWDDQAFDQTRASSARVPLFGVNALRSNRMGLEPIRIGLEPIQIEEKVTGDDSISDDDAACLLLAAVGSRRDLPFRFPEWIENAVREYQTIRFGKDGAFVGGDALVRDRPWPGESSGRLVLSVPRTKVEKTGESDPASPTMQVEYDLLMKIEYFDGAKGPFVSGKFARDRTDDEVPADRMCGTDAAREIFLNTLDRAFLDFFVTRKMEPKMDSPR